MIADLRLGTVWVPKLEQFLLSNVPKLDSDLLGPFFSSWRTAGHTWYRT